MTKYTLITDKFKVKMPKKGVNNASIVNDSTRRKEDSMKVVAIRKDRIEFNPVVVEACSYDLDGTERMLTVNVWVGGIIGTSGSCSKRYTTTYGSSPPYHLLQKAFFDAVADANIKVSLGDGRDGSFAVHTAALAIAKANSKESDGYNFQVV